MPDMLTISGAAKQFQEANRNTLSPSWLATCRLACKWLEAVVGDKAVGELSPGDGERLLNELLDRRRSENTAGMYLRALKSWANWMVGRGILQASPFSPVRMPKFRRSEVNYYEDDQFRKLIEACSSPLFRPCDISGRVGLRWRARLIGARAHGLRRGELLNLTWDDISDDWVRVRPKAHTSKTWPWRIKTDLERKVPASRYFLEAIEPFRDRYYPLLSRQNIERCLRLADEGVIQCGRERQAKLPDPSWRWDWTRLQEIAFGKQIGTFHDVRKTFATYASAYLPEAALMQLCGWVRRETVRAYAGVRQEWLADHSRQIDAAIEGMGV